MTWAPCLTWADTMEVDPCSVHGEVIDSECCYTCYRHQKVAIAGRERRMPALCHLCYHGYWHWFLINLCWLSCQLSAQEQCVYPSIVLTHILLVKSIYLNFQPLYLVSRYSDPQLQVVENYSYGLKKNIVCSRFPTDPIKTCATQIYFMGFQKKKKKKFFFFFFQGIHKLRDDLLTVRKVTLLKNVTKRRGGSKSIQKTKKSLCNVQIRHQWKWIWRWIKFKKILTYRLVEVTKNKIKNKINFLPTHWLKWQQIGNKHIFFFGLFV